MEERRTGRKVRPSKDLFNYVEVEDAIEFEEAKLKQLSESSMDFEEERKDATDSLEDFSRQLTAQIEADMETPVSEDHVEDVEEDDLDGDDDGDPQKSSVSLPLDFLPSDPPEDTKDDGGDSPEAQRLSHHGALRPVHIREAYRRVKNCAKIGNGVHLGTLGERGRLFRYST